MGTAPKKYIYIPFRKKCVIKKKKKNSYCIFVDFFQQFLYFFFFFDCKIFFAKKFLCLNLFEVAKKCAAKQKKNEKKRKG